MCLSLTAGRSLRFSTRPVKKNAPAIISASGLVLAISDIVTGNSATSSSMSLPNGAARMAKKTSTMLARRLNSLAR